MSQSLSDSELEWRRVLGRRILQATQNAELSISELANLIGEAVPMVSRYTRGLRKISPQALAAIARVTGVTVEDLCADEDTPLPPPSRTGRCRDQFVIESSGPGYRIAMLLGCDLPAHDDTEDHHDQRGFRWAYDNIPSSD